MKAAVCLIAICCLVRHAAGQLVSFPLEGYYRPGQYMPVRISNVRAPVTIGAEGCVPTIIEGQGEALDLVAPLLVLREGFSSVVLRSGDQTHAVAFAGHRLSDHDVFIAADCERDEQVERLISSGRRPIWLRLPERAAGSTAAWDAVDALVLSEPRNLRLDERVMSVWSSLGSSLILRSETAPDARWPWRQAGAWWVLKSDPVGPRSAICPGAYSAAAAWPTGTSLRLRAGVFVTAALVVILLLAASLLKARVAVLAVVALSAVAAIALPWWYGTQPKVRQAAGTVAIAMPHWVQMDLWSYYKSPAAARSLAMETRPMLADPEQAREIGLSLHVKASAPEEGWYEFSLPANGRVAFLSRYLSAGKIEPGGGQNSPMRSVARAVYEGRRVMVVGEGPDVSPKLADVRLWPPVILRREE